MKSSHLPSFATDIGFQALITGRQIDQTTKNAAYLVECETKQQSDLLLKSHKLVDRPIKLSMHDTLISSSGVICCHDLVRMADIDIRDELKDQGVATVKRFRIKLAKSRKEKTSTFFLMFCNTYLCHDIRTGHLRAKPDLLCSLHCVVSSAQTLAWYLEMQGRSSVF